MGQEKSVPIRCNTCHNYSTSIKTSASLSSSTSNLPISSSTHNTAPSPIRFPSHSNTNKSTKSSQSSNHTLNTSHTRLSRLSTGSTTSSSSSYKSIENQTKYLNHQLYIKSYLDIIEEDRAAALQFQPARNGIRNYTPKILLEQTTQTTSTSASSTSSNEQEDIDIWI